MQRKEDERKEEERRERQKKHARKLSKDGLLSVNSAKTRKDRDGDDGGSDSDVSGLNLPASVVAKQTKK
jgi:hypothetical protein